ncbi:ribonucleotide-diphosphate reductase subunit beta [Halobacteriaceae archaeon GCM10025711]
MTGDLLQIDRSERAARYYRNAVDRHWDPDDVDLSADRDAMAALDEVAFREFRTSLAKFGAGEQAVTEDLAPLAVVLEPLEDQLFVTTQLYEEARHTDFFDRYWRDVVHPAEEDRGLERTSPTDPEWFDADYRELFDRNEAAMARLLTEDTPETRAEAYCHYHLTIEGVLAQTGYYGLTRAFGGRVEGMPELPGLVDGLTRIRQDEGRHVGFGMAKLRELVQDEGVDPALLHDTVGDLVELVQGTLDSDLPPEEQAVPPEELTAYAVRKHTERMEQITDAASDIPTIDELTSLDG